MKEMRVLVDTTEGMKRGLLMQLIADAGLEIMETDVKALAGKINDAFEALEEKSNKPDAVKVPNALVLTGEQIKVLAEFAAKENQPSYKICHAEIPASEELEEYSGLIAFSYSEESGVLQLS